MRNWLVVGRRVGRRDARASRPPTVRRDSAQLRRECQETTAAMPPTTMIVPCVFPTYVKPIISLNKNWYK